MVNGVQFLNDVRFSNGIRFSNGFEQNVAILFGFQMARTIWKPNMASLDHFIYKEKELFIYKTT